MGTEVKRTTFKPRATAGQPSLFPDLGSEEPRARALLAKASAREVADGVVSKFRVAFAQHFTATALSAYWQKVHGSKRIRPNPPLPVLARDPDSDDARALGHCAAALPPDDAAYLIGSTYAAMLPPDLRSANGVFYTPPAVASRLLDSVEAAGLDWRTARVLDPACGGGAFLAPVATRMLAAMRDVEPRVAARNIAHRLKGYELDPFAAWISEVFLDATVSSMLGVPLGPIGSIEVCDSIGRSGLDQFDLVIGNPPYGKVTLPPERRAVFERSLFGHANLYGLFMDLATRMTKVGGLVAFVTPTSFLSGEYFKRLRGLLTREAPPVAIDFVDDRQGVFDDVLQETVLGVYRRGAVRPTTAVSFVSVRADGSDVAPGGSITVPAASELPWLLPRSPSDVLLSAAMRKMPTRLKDWGYTVSTGPLVWNRHKPQLRWDQVKGCVPIIWAEAVSPDGEFEFRAERRNHAPFLFMRPGDDALLVRNPCVLLQRTTAKEQARRLIAAEMPAAFIARHGGAVTVENHLNMVLPTTDKPAVSTALLSRFLNSGVADRVFRCISGSVAASAYEIEAMPLPSAEDLRRVNKLLVDGRPGAEIERAFERLYTP